MIFQLKKTARQAQAVAVLISAAVEILLYGGSRSGKTFILVYAIFVRALKAPNTHHLIVRKHLNHAIQSIWLGTLRRVIKVLGLSGKCNFNNKWFYVTLPNGSEIWVSGTDDKERLEKALGNEYSTVYLNECSQIPYAAVDILSTRLAEKSCLKNKMYFDCNPPTKSHWLYKKFFKFQNPIDKSPLDPKRHATLQMNPTDNLENLADDYLSKLDNLTHKDRVRFRDGEFRDDSEGTLFKEQWIKRYFKHPDYERIVIGVDPATTNNEDSCETGIVAAGKRGSIGCIIADASGKFSPSGWGEAVVRLYRSLNADAVVAEVNNGGDMVEHVIKTIDPTIRVIKVHASRGKVKRAEHVSGKYERGEMEHFDYLNELESQMYDFKTIVEEGEDSPDRADAMVWAITELFDLYEGSITATLL